MGGDYKGRKASKMLDEIIDNATNEQDLSAEQIRTYFQNPDIIMLKYLCRHIMHFRSRSLTRIMGEETRGYLRSLKNRGLVEALDTTKYSYKVSADGIKVYRYLTRQRYKQRKAEKDALRTD